MVRFPCDLDPDLRAEIVRGVALRASESAHHRNVCVVPTPQAVMRKAGCRVVLVGFSGDAGMVEVHREAGADLSWSKPLPRKPELIAGLATAFAARRR